MPISMSPVSTSRNSARVADARRRRGACRHRRWSAYHGVNGAKPTRERVTRVRSYSWWTRHGAARGRNAQFRGRAISWATITSGALQALRVGALASGSEAECSTTISFHGQSLLVRVSRSNPLFTEGATAAGISEVFHPRQPGPAPFAARALDRLVQFPRPRRPSLDPPPRLHDGVVQGLQELGSVRRREGFRAAGDLAHRAKVLADRPRGQGAPMLSVVNSRPVGCTAWAPAASDRWARGMSAVMTTSRGPARSAIQSSAASGPASTTTEVMRGLVGVRSQLLETTNTFSP